MPAASTPSNTNSDKERMICGPQEVLLLRILSAWAILLVGVGWLWKPTTEIGPQQIVGWAANLNVVFFFAAPLSAMRRVISQRSSASIHVPTMVMNWLNCSFWMLYGFIAKHDAVIYMPNAVGLFLGLLQGLLCCLYPHTDNGNTDIDGDAAAVDPRPLLSNDELQGGDGGGAVGEIATADDDGDNPNDSSSGQVV